MAEALLEVSSLRKRFGAVQASNDLSFTVDHGEIHALIGPNGAGKTTAINQLMGELRPDSGRILFDGRDITRLPVHQRAHRGLARSFQVTAVFDRLTTAENLALALQAHMGHSFRFWRRADREPKLQQQLAEALVTVDLVQRANDLAADLSHGEKRQLEVGMALAGRPKLLLLDEPMAGLGPGGTVALSHLISELKGEMSILLIEHDMDVVFSLADRVTVLVYGRAIATGTPDQIRTDPAVRQAYLGDEV